MSDAEVIDRSFLSIQVCVPEGWCDKEVKAFAEREDPCVRGNGWFIRKENDPALEGDPERQPCASRDGYVHIVLDA